MCDNTIVLHKGCQSQACARAWWCEQMLTVPQVPPLIIFWMAHVTL